MQQAFLGRSLAKGEDIHPEVTGGHRGNQTEDGDHGQSDNGIRLASLRIAVEIVAHLPNFVAYFFVQLVIMQVIRTQAENCLNMRALGQLVKPVTVGKAQEGLEVGTNPSLEAAYRYLVADVEIIDGVNEQVGKNQQRSSMQMRNQKDQEILVSELRQYARLLVNEKRLGGVSDKGKGVAGADEARVGAGLGIVPEAILTITLFEIGYSGFIYRK